MSRTRPVVTATTLLVGVTLALAATPATAAPKLGGGTLNGGTLNGGTLNAGVPD